jgi:hypothetical protein
MIIDPAVRAQYGGDRDQMIDVRRFAGVLPRLRSMLLAGEQGRLEQWATIGLVVAVLHPEISLVDSALRVNLVCDCRV